MKNPFEKYLTPEDHFQHQVITWLQFQYPGLRYHHSPNEGKRTVFEQFKYKYLGSDSGFPDLQFPSLLLVIELKIKPNRPTKNQLDWLEYFKRIGWQTAVCYTFEEVTNVIRAAIKQQVSILSSKQ